MQAAWTRRRLIKIPAHAIAKGAPYDAIRSADALAELAAWFSNAEILLAKFNVN